MLLLQREYKLIILCNLVNERMSWFGVLVKGLISSVWIISNFWKTVTLSFNVYVNVRGGGGGEG